MLTKDQGKSSSAQQKLQAAILSAIYDTAFRIWIELYLFIYCFLYLLFTVLSAPDPNDTCLFFFCYDIGSIVLSHYHHPLSCTLHVVDSIERTLWRLTTSQVHSLGLKLAWRLENTSSEDEQLHLSLNEEIFLLLSKYGKDKQERGSFYWFTDKKKLLYSVHSQNGPNQKHIHTDFIFIQQYFVVVFRVQLYCEKMTFMYTNNMLCWEYTSVELPFASFFS